MEILREVFKKTFTEEVKPCTLGFYEEKKAFPFLEPKSERWSLKPKRPLKVVDASEEEVLFTLFSTRGDFKCPDKPFKGIGKESSKVDLSRCALLEERCGWIKKEVEVYVFKKPHRSFCYVWALPTKVFKQYVILCGPCGDSPFSQELERAVREEVEKYKRRRLKNGAL